MKVSSLHRVVEPPRAEETPKVGSAPPLPRDAEAPERVRDRRIGAGLAALGQVGDLLVDVRKGLEENAAQPERLDADRRLLESAAASVLHIVHSARANGLPVFSEPQTGVRSAPGLRAYLASQGAYSASVFAAEQDPAARGALARAQGRLAGPEGVASGLLRLSRQEGGASLDSLDRLVAETQADLQDAARPAVVRA